MKEITFSLLHKTVFIIAVTLRKEEQSWQNTLISIISFQQTYQIKRLSQTRTIKIPFSGCYFLTEKIYSHFIMQ